jgi:hypothetical protein
MTMTLFASPQDQEHEQDQPQENNSNNSNSKKDSQASPSPSASPSTWRRRVKRLASGLVGGAAAWTTKQAPAHAKFSYEIIQEQRTHSLRPGVNQNQAEQMLEGELPEDLPEAESIFQRKTTESPPTNSNRNSNSKTATKKSEATTAKNKKKTTSFDYGDEEEGDEEFLEDQALDTEAAASSATSSSSNQALGELVQSRSKSSFTGVVNRSPAKSTALRAKLSVGLFIPTLGAMFLREFVRRGKEEKYVKKGLEILKAQKAEYFNVTATDDGDGKSDSEIQDELNELKDDDDEDDDDDDEDDDDDDDDDDDEPEPPKSRRTPPKKPSGGGSGNSNSGSGGTGTSNSPKKGGDNGGEDQKPSDEDLKKLGDLFDKS